MHSFSRPAALAAFLLATAAPMGASALSFTGTFTRDDDVQTFLFSVATPGIFALQTFSYAGGTNGAAVVIAAGGFDPVLSVFDAAGTLVVSQDDATPDCNGVAHDPVTNECFDNYLIMTLAAGNYTAAISQFDNEPVGPAFSNGFSKTGNATLTAVFGCSNGRFCDVDADNRTGFWAADVTAVPVPAAAWLVASALSALAWVRRRPA